MRGIYSRHILKAHTNKASVNSCAKGAPAKKYPVKKEPAAPMANMVAAVWNRRNLLSSCITLEPKGEKGTRVLSRSMPNCFNIINSKIVGATKSTMANLESGVSPKTSEKISVNEPRTKITTVDTRK